MPRHVVLLAAIPLVLLADVTPRDGWSLVAGAEDLVQNGSWGCLNSVSTDSSTITVTATTGYNTVINTSGPVLRTQGDFSVLATLSSANNPQTYLTLVGSLNTGGGSWWQGLQRLDVGITGDGVTMLYWMGDSADASSFTFPDVDGRGDPYNLEVARIGTDLVVFVNGAEAGRAADPGLFASGQVYLGFNAAPGNTLVIQALAAAAPSDGSSNTTLFAPYLVTAQRTGTALRDVADAAGFLVGTAVDPARLAIDQYRETLGREYNLMVAENAMKFDALHPAADRYNFCAADNLIAFAQANGMQVRAHNLVWQDALPDWLAKGTYTREEGIAILQDHINTVVAHFKGKVLGWDVVNESIAYGPPYGPQPSFWLNTIGPDYVDLAFQFARAADPDMKLFYNDTGGEGLGAKSDAVYNLVKGMLSRGVPLDGVGLQMHVTLANAPSADALNANLQQLIQLGLDVHITEMDVAIKVPASDSELAAQADIYQRVTSACLANPGCKAVLTWGFTDAYSWIPGFMPGFGAALPFDESYQPKPAYQAIWNTLAAASGWQH